MREITHQNVYSASFLGSSNATQLRPRTDFYAQYVKWRGFAEGRAFLGLENKNLIFKPSYSRKTTILGPAWTGQFSTKNCFTVGDAPCKFPLIVIVGPLKLYSEYANWGHW